MLDIPRLFWRWASQIRPTSIVSGDLNQSIRILTHCGLVMSYGDINMGQHWLSYGLVPWNGLINPLSIAIVSVQTVKQSNPFTLDILSLRTKMAATLQTKISISVYQTFWNFAQGTTTTLPCFAQNLRWIYQLQGMLQPNEICHNVHWARVTHICVSKLTIIGSDNGLLSDRRLAIIWTNAGLLFIGPLGINFSGILIEI